MKRHWLKFTAGQWSAALLIFLDLIALGALVFTGEVPLWVFGSALGICALSRILRVEIPTRFLAALFLPLFFGATLLWVGMRMHPVVAAAHAVPFAHALLWWAPRTTVYRGWRVALGFIELILASGLTAEAYLPLLIVIFVVVGSVAVSCDFMDRELAARAPEERDGLLTGAFIRNSVGLSFLIFLTSAIIFPILPRPRGLNLELGSTMIGYTETVSLSEWSRLNPDSGGAVQLRLYPPAETDLGYEVYLGLLRGKALDLFDGINWYASPRSKHILPAGPAVASQGTKSLRIEVAREAIAQGTLPVPYGTRGAWVLADDHLASIPRSRAGDFIEESAAGRRFRYAIDLIPNELGYLRSDLERDRPGDIHLSIPRRLQTDRLERLAGQIFGKTRGTREKINRLREYFRKEGFTATSSQNFDDDAMGRQLKRTQLTPLEQFLFVTHQGHCEWFATASAMLLRFADVPTRLVAGFRMTQSQLGGVLTVRSGDAHAWLEAYVPEQGWMPIDLTPRITRGGSLSESLRQISDVFSAYWYKHVVTFGEDAVQGKLAQALTHWWKGERDFSKPQRPMIEDDTKETPPEAWALLAAGAVIFIGIGFLLWRRLRVSTAGAHPKLARERLRMATLLSVPDLDLREDPSRVIQAIGLRHGPDGAETYARWHSTYVRLRFGPAHQSSNENLRSGILDLKLLSSELRSLRR